MSYRELLLKLMDGINDARIRSDITSAFNVIMHAYRVGRIDDNKLLKALRELCLDVLMEKHPLKDIEELKQEADRLAEELYRSIRAVTIRDRYRELMETSE
jgi:predicted RNA binding protein with dsRBD fold (UPF0201 family)